MLELLHKVYNGAYLTMQESQDFVTGIMTDNFDPVEAASLLSLLSYRGETAEEIAGAAKAVASSWVNLNFADADIYDVVGTGGDGKSTVNISTAVAISLAAMGIKCVKHGNKAQSGLVGSADILQYCGLDIEADPQSYNDLLQKHNFVFLYAPFLHPSLRFAKAIRQSIKLPTLFNYLGPLSNPAEPKATAIGVNSVQKLAVLAKAAKLAGKKDCSFYSAEDAYDEISTAAKSHVLSPEQGPLTIDPSEFFTPFPMPRVSSVEHAIKSFTRMLAGTDERLSCTLALNTALPLYLFKKSPTVHKAYDDALLFIRSGAALRKLQSMVK